MDMMLVSLLLLIVGGSGIIKFFFWKFGKECEKELEKIKQEVEQRCKRIENLLEES